MTVTFELESYFRIFDIGVAMGGAGVQVHSQGDQKNFLGVFVGMRQKMELNLVRCSPADEKVVDGSI